MADKIKFKDWITRKGVKELAAELEVDPSTIRYWRLGTAVPRPREMQKIYKMSKGTVTYQEMVENGLSRKD